MAAPKITWLEVCIMPGTRRYRVRGQFGSETWTQALMVTPSGLTLPTNKMVASPGIDVRLWNITG